MNMIICGLPASGKTTVGKIIANQLSWTHIDTDELIIADYHDSSITTCRQICFIEGEKFFRSLERSQILKLAHLKNNVISVGGGCLSYFDNDKSLKKIGCMVYLKIEISFLWSRLEERGLPPYLNTFQPKIEFEQIMKKRQKQLELVADLTIEVENLNPEEVAACIFAKWKKNHGK